MRECATAERLCIAPMNWTAENVFAATGGVAHPGMRTDLQFTSVTTDSRYVPPGALFFALHGPHHDGHDHVAEALRAGARAAVVDRTLNDPDLTALIRVDDTLTALGDLAAWTRAQHAVRVVAITGSNGKTTTKDLIAAICAAAPLVPPRTRVLKTEGNLNNLIGLPLTLLQLQGDEAVAVLEMGMNRFGEIARLTAIARPDYAVITNIGPAHLEGVGGSVAGVAQAKGELFAGLSPEAGIAVNTDDEWIGRLAAAFHGRRVTYGQRGEVQAHHLVDLGSDGTAFALAIGARTAKVRLRLIGPHNVMNALAAAAVAHAMGLDLDVIVRGLERCAGAAMRLQAHHLPNGVTLINDAYNANPSSVEAALVALRRSSARLVVVLGEMRELGDEARRAHHLVGERAAALGVQELFVLGTQAETMAAGARAGGMRTDAIHVCGSHAEVAAAVVARWQPGDTVLVKGSRGMKMEEVVRLLREAGSAS